jgi:hypothetical protein
VQRRDHDSAFTIWSLGSESESESGPNSPAGPASSLFRTSSEDFLALAAEQEDERQALLERVRVAEAGALAAARPSGLRKLVSMISDRSREATVLEMFGPPRKLLKLATNAFRKGGEGAPGNKFQKLHKRHVLQERDIRETQAMLTAFAARFQKPAPRATLPPVVDNVAVRRWKLAIREVTVY